MKPVTILGLVLVVAGVLALAYGGFTYTKETHDIELGPLELQVEEKEPRRRAADLPRLGGQESGRAAAYRSAGLWRGGVRRLTMSAASLRPPVFTPSIAVSTST